jgi:hypothetical protein
MRTRVRRARKRGSTVNQIMMRRKKTSRQEELLLQVLRRFKELELEFRESSFHHQRCPQIM